MAERSRRSLRGPLPATPQRRGGHLESLLAQFVSQTSAESATRLRRASSQIAPKQEAEADAEVVAAPPSVDNRRTLRQRQAPPVYLPPSPSTIGTEPAEIQPERRLSARQAVQNAASPSSTESASDSGTSEDELAPRPIRARDYKNNLRSNEAYSDLKMELRTKSSDHDGPRRRSGRHTRVLESDTVEQRAPTPTRRKTAKAPKLDTARARLRDDIAHKTKGKASNFLVAHKDYFLPLLPSYNHVAKLVANHKASPIVEYKEL